MTADDVITKMVSQEGFYWPSRSPDLNPCDFFLWGHVKHHVFLRQPRSLAELKTAIEIEISSIAPETLYKVVDSMFARLLSVLATDGKHIE